MGFGDEESPVTLPDLADRSVQVGAPLAIHHLFLPLKAFLLLARQVGQVGKFAERRERLRRWRKGVYLPHKLEWLTFVSVVHLPLFITDK